MAYIFPLSQQQLDTLSKMGENPDNPMFIMLGDGTLQISDTTFIAPNGTFVSQAPVDPYDPGYKDWVDNERKPGQPPASAHNPEDSLIPSSTNNNPEDLPWQIIFTLGAVGVAMYFLLKV